jgi:hypothetical protein
MENLYRSWEWWLKSSNANHYFCQFHRKLSYGNQANKQQAVVTVKHVSARHYHPYNPYTHYQLWHKIWSTRNFELSILLMISNIHTILPDKFAWTHLKPEVLSSQWSILCWGIGIVSFYARTVWSKARYLYDYLHLHDTFQLWNQR